MVHRVSREGYKDKVATFQVKDSLAWFLLALLVYNKSEKGEERRERRSDERGARSPARIACSRQRLNLMILQTHTNASKHMPPPVSAAPLSSLTPVANHYFVPPPPLIAICRPYLEPARFTCQNFSVKLPFYLAQI